MSCTEDSSAYPPVKDRMSRARTPLGAVPISTIYGFEYPLNNGVERDISSKHEKLCDSVDYMIRSSRAFSENRVADPYYTSLPTSSLSFMPMALRASRSNTPIRGESQFRDTSVPPVTRSTARKLLNEVPDVAPKTATMTFSSTSPWDSTGFYYSPRYPQSHRGTASTYSSFSRRYFDDFNYFNPYAYGNPVQSDYFRHPVRRFVPSYVPFRYSRRY